MLTWSIATVSMGGTLETKLSSAARAGFRAIEIFENDLTFFNGKPRDVRAMADDLGLSIIALQPMRDFEAMPEPMRSRNFERAQRKFELMHELGTNLLSVCSNVAPDAINDPHKAADDLARLADLAAQSGLRIGYEALAWGRHVRDWMQAWEIVHLANRPNLGIVLDSFHTIQRGNPLAPIADLPASHIALVQVADAPAILMDPMSLSRHHRCFPGQGDYDITGFLKAALSTGYRGPISLEIFNEQFRGAPASIIARDGMRSLQVCAEQLHDVMPKDKAQPISSSQLLPKPARINNVEFIEFVSSGAEASRLTHILRGLGFTRVAKHRSKNVELYRQNNLNIVVNLEQDGFAYSFYLVHGTSICAIALEFDDPERALERANALGETTYFGRIGPGEATIPAVRGVENSLIYFLPEHKEGQANWEKDFVFTSQNNPQGPLTRLDHFSNVVRRAEFLSWVLFYKSIFGFENEPQVELADPYGAFFSRLIRSAEGNVHIPLNIGDGGSTAVSRFIDTFGGGGVQQIAFATDDLFGFVRQARAAGVSFLDIPKNYYDDLEARYDIDPALLHDMRELNILYDRSDDGEFFQIYTTTFDDRFFFEILERRNYKLFGAANTPVRLAAQTHMQDVSRAHKALLGG
jgi:4-hydroxyphenylpyruvate dioxygenase